MKLWLKVFVRVKIVLIICGILYNMKMGDLLLKNYWRCQDGNSRARNQEGGPSERRTLCSCPAYRPVQPALVWMFVSHLGSDVKLFSYCESQAYKLEGHRSNMCQDSCVRVAVDTQQRGAGSKPPVFSHSISSLLTSTRAAGSTSLAPACLCLVSAVLPTQLCLAPGTQLFHLQLPLFLACLATWGTLLLGAP